MIPFFRNKFRLLLLIALSGSSHVCAQESDSVFTHEEFLTIVRTHHPLSHVAELTGNQAEYLVKNAKGGFDPKLYGNLNQKYFDGTNYYSYLNAGLKVPTWFGITLQAGYDANSGVRLNPENYTSNAGLWNAGIAIQLGNGLLIDQRRAELRQAEIYANSSQLEQELMMDQLVFDASVAYFEWSKAYNYFVVNQTAVENASARLNNIRGMAQFGDKPSIDTLKALIFLQERQLSLERTRLDLENKRAQLEVFLWQDGFIPLEISDALAPPRTEDLATSNPPIVSQEMIDTLAQNHPEFLMSQNKLSITKIDYRLKREQLKPNIELKYNALGTDANQNLFNDYSAGNYAWGATISYPIFTRKERAQVKLTELKLEQQEAQLGLKNAELGYKIETSFNVWTSTVNQLNIYRQSVDDYQRLLESEIILFEIGEGSMFLVNIRDQEYIDAQLKLIEIIVQNKLGEVWYDYARVR